MINIDQHLKNRINAMKHNLKVENNKVIKNHNLIKELKNEIEKHKNTLNR
tara:strand:- start:3373 stop:3522 length:150 start_codon:yes stop_codon:yes gene_type:complete